MLEHLNLKQKVTKDDYKQRLPELQDRLLDLEQAVYREHVPVLIVFEGWAAAGKGSTINVLAEHLDPRGFRVVPITPPRTYEQRHPWMWRFWQRIPAYGQIVVFDTSYYRRVLIDRVQKQIRRREVTAGFDDIRDFEAQLAADGTLIVKYWLHISRREQAKRFKLLLADELTAWQVTDEDSAQHKAYGRYEEAVEEMLAHTEAAYAPWTVVEATDRRFTRLKVLETLVRTLEARLKTEPPAPASTETSAAPAAAAPGHNGPGPKPQEAGDARND